eukprot:CAMPEP_0180579018 /NCGR_PEP_ID=MMETSP1037_2-20121125/12769_1 /TAXON_ID=632150 /ORGANISM="Azadinium spinosum, Strain 3D9" /LENGTH=51 /DNA_ID=CAMNT_0022596855 /DNA_START=101 /DNA_END=253 /DNA_ORIENTATION=-
MKTQQRCSNNAQGLKGHASTACVLQPGSLAGIMPAPFQTILAKTLYQRTTR